MIASLTQRYFGLNTSNKIRFSSFDSIEKEVVTLDGARLSTTHLAPHSNTNSSEGVETSPCVIIRTPYYRQFWYMLAIHLVHRGYHVLLQDVRGRFESTGEFTMGRNEKKDAACTFRWISQQRWSNREIGLLGVSMDGYTSWASFASSLEQDLGVKVRAIVPALTSSDILKSGIFAAPAEHREDPVVHLELVAKYSGLMYQLNHPRTSLGSQLLWVIFKCAGFFVTTRKRQWKQQVAMHLPLSTIDIAATTAIPEPRLELVTNPNDQYWSDIDHSWAVRKLAPNRSHAAFITGWYDIFTQTTLRDFQLAVEGSPEHPVGDDSITLTIGDYSHFDDYFSITMREAIRTFENALQTTTDVKHYPKRRKRVRVICLGANGFFFQRRPLWEKALALLSPARSAFSTLNEDHHAWREFDYFPPKEAREEQLKLAPANRILPVNQSVLGPRFNHDDSDIYIYDPHSPTPTLGGPLFDIFAGIAEQTPLMNRDDVVFYQTPELKDVVEIAGEVSFDCLASSSARSMDIFAKLSITNPDGTTYNLCEGIGRKTLDISKGEEWPQRISVNVGPICAQFVKGSRICLILSSGSFPKYSRNLGYGEAVHHATTMTSAKQTHLLEPIYFDSSCHSRITI